MNLTKFHRVCVTSAVALAALFSADRILAADVTRTPLPGDHPLIGSWRIDLPDVQCHEIYNIRADGTTFVTSASEVASSDFEIDLKPSSRGFYKWVDKITSDNGQPDCMGSTDEAGHVATNFIFLNKSGKQFLMCEQEDLRTCIGPFVRQEGI